MVLGIPNYIPVIFEGKVLGLIRNDDSYKFCDNLRYHLKNPNSKSGMNLLSITLVKENLLN
jgi:hypothetical protein